MDVSWHPHLPDGSMLSVSATHCELIWPWAGWVALSLFVTKEGATFEGVIEVRYLFIS